MLKKRRYYVIIPPSSIPIGQEPVVPLILKQKDAEVKAQLLNRRLTYLHAKLVFR